MMDDDLTMNDPLPCPLCGGEGEPLGTLGRQAHFRCCDCGVAFHIEAYSEAMGLDIELPEGGES